VDIIDLDMTGGLSLHWVLIHFVAIAFARSSFGLTVPGGRRRAASRIPKFPPETVRMQELRMMQSQEKPLT
jgi:hypothetical protein